MPPRLTLNYILGLTNKNSTIFNNNDYYQLYSQVKGTNMLNSNTKQSLGATMDSLKNSPKALSPNQDFFKNFDDNIATATKYDAKYGSDYVNDLTASNLSMFNINTSAEKQLNFSRGISSRQVNFYISFNVI